MAIRSYLFSVTVTTRIDKVTNFNSDNVKAGLKTCDWPAKN